MLLDHVRDLAGGAVADLPDDRPGVAVVRGVPGSGPG